jgi:O-antigen ligase
MSTTTAEADDDTEPPVVRRSRSSRRKQRRRRSSTNGLPRPLLYATVALLALVPLPIGGQPDWAASLAACLVAGLLLGWCIIAPGRSLQPHVPAVLVVAALLIAGVSVWSLLQVTPGFLPEAWSHPIWARAAAAGLDVEGVVSLNRSASGEALMRLLAACGMFLLAFVLARREADARLLLACILAIITGYAAFGLVDQLLAWRLAEGVGFRSTVSSTFINRNHFATYANLGLVTALGFILEPLLRGRSEAAEEKLGRRIAAAITLVLEERRYPLMAAVILLLASVGSNSRGGFLSLLGAATFILLLVLLVSRVRPATKLWVILAGLAALGLVIWLTGANLLERFGALELEGGGSRPAAWQMTLDAIRERPLLGYGHGAYVEIFFLRHDVAMGIGVFDHAHNDWLQTAAELGLPAASALWLAQLLLFGLCVHGALARRRRRLYPLVGAGAACLVALHAVTDFSLLIPAVALTFAALFGIGCAQSTAKSRG